MEDYNIDEKSPITQNDMDTIGDPNAPVALTIKDVRSSVPAKFSKMIDQAFVDHLNNIAKDPMEALYIRDNFITYGSVLNEGKYSVVDYMNAVKYISYLMLNMTKASAYSKTFPDRYKRLIDMGKDQRYISAYVSAYDSNKLVTEIRKQTLVPVYIHNRGLLQRAINVQAEIMLDDKNSPFVRSMASKHLMDALKEPAEVAQLNIAVNTGTVDNSSIDALSDALNKLTDVQEKVVASGAVTTKQIAEMDITVAEFKEID